MEMPHYLPLDVDRIRAGIGSGVVGCHLHYEPDVASTNRVAHDLLCQGYAHGTVVMADYQSAGRGRGQRTWVAPPRSSLLLSIILELPAETIATDAVMLAGVAVDDAVSEFTDLQVELKWPNDVLVRGRKLAGILAQSERGQADHVVLGIGINANFSVRDYPDIAPFATTLRDELGYEIDREALAIALFRHIDLWYRNLTRDAHQVYSAWASRLDVMGSPLLIVDGSGTWTGAATGVQRDGALIVRADDGEVRTLYAADVSIRKAGNFTSS